MCETVNNYDFGLYQDGEVFIQTTPEQLAANNGKVYLTVRELVRLLALAKDHKEHFVTCERCGVVATAHGPHSLPDNWDQWEGGAVYCDRCTKQLTQWLLQAIRD